MIKEGAANFYISCGIIFLSHFFEHRKTPSKLAFFNLEYRTDNIILEILAPINSKNDFLFQFTIDDIRSYYEMI